MKKITCIQRYVIDGLITENKLSINSLIDATSKVCSTEQFNNILSIIIESDNCSTKETEKSKLLRINMYISKEITGAHKVDIVRILKEQLKFGLKETKDYVDSCVGKFNIFPKAITHEQAETLVSRLSNYDVSISFC